MYLDRTTGTLTSACTWTRASKRVRAGEADR